MPKPQKLQPGSKGKPTYTYACRIALVTYFLYSLHLSRPGRIE